MSEQDFSAVQTLPVRIADRLRDDIIKQRLTPGSHITAKEIADKWKVSQVPVREAFSILCGEGLLDITAYRGATVLELSEEKINEINSIVGAMETVLVRMCINKGYTEEILSELERINNEIAAIDSDDLDGLKYRRVKLNSEFHKTEYSIVEGTEPYKVYSRYVNTLWAIRRYYAMAPSRVQETAREHAMIIKAIREKNGDEAARWHLLHSANSAFRFAESFKIEDSNESIGENNE